MKRFGVILFLFLFWIFLLSAIVHMPSFGDPRNIANNYMAESNFAADVAQTGNNNFVTAFLFNFRGYDTFMLSVEIFTSLICVLSVLKREKKTDTTRLEYSPVIPSLIISSIAKFFIPLILLFGFYMVFQGLSSAGGGFIGGAIIAGGILLFTLIFGLRSYVNKLPILFRQHIEILAIIAFIAAGSLGLLLKANFLAFPFSVFCLKNQIFLRQSITVFLEIALGISFGVILTSMFASIEKLD